MAKICLLTPGQPSINPRLVKEADALVDAGHEVVVLCSHYIGWADEADQMLLKRCGWKCVYLGGECESASVRYFCTRLRYGLTRRLPPIWSLTPTFRRWALSRITPELLSAAIDEAADLYIAHYTSALEPAAAAAAKNRAQLAFDAEDFESGYYTYEMGVTAIDRLIEGIERRCLPMCSYVTAASPDIAEAYAEKYSIPTPTTILNVFPLDQRPESFRPSLNNREMRLYWFSQTIGLERGLADAIRALGQLKDCNIQLHLRGRCASEQWRQLWKLAASIGVESRIELQPPAPPDQMISLAVDMDVGLALEQAVSPNRELCLTNKIFSYLLAGNAVAATATRAQRPIMNTIGDAGFTYQQGDIGALASGLRRWYEDPCLLLEARRKSWDWGTRQYNWDYERKKFLQVVAHVLDKENCAITVGR